MNDFERGVRKALEEFKLYFCDDSERYYAFTIPVRESEFDEFVHDCISSVLWEENNK